jgi:hypothetical protein
VSSSTSVLYLYHSFHLKLFPLFFLHLLRALYFLGPTSKPFSPRLYLLIFWRKIFSFPFWPYSS